MKYYQQIIELIKENGIVNAKDLKNIGISKNYLYKYSAEGKLIKLSRGLYTIPEMLNSEHTSLAEVAKRIPMAVVCLISSLFYHNITTQIPNETWICLPRGHWRPCQEYPVINITYLSKESYNYGIQEYEINSVKVRIYSPAKTIADCFKFRSKIGLDVAIEALREAIRLRKCTVDEIIEASKINRVYKIIFPYLEAVV